MKANLRPLPVETRHEPYSEAAGPHLPDEIRKCRSAVIKLGPRHGGKPWWWDELRADEGLSLTVHYVQYRNKRSSKEIGALELPLFLLKMLSEYLRLRREYDYVFTFENSLTTFGLAFWQTVLLSGRPRHVVLQFIMRERTAKLKSRLKYLMMKWCFSSIHVAVCSATAEASYYRETFGWPNEKVAFVPCHTSIEFARIENLPDDGYLLAAGRTLRDFPTLVSALRNSTHPTVIVAPRKAVGVPDGVQNIEILEEIPFSEFEKLMERCRAVVIPLHDRNISTGQVVLLHAMALGKPVIATRTTGTRDYIVDGQNGLLVEPRNPHALRVAMDRLMSDSELRERIGTAARETVMARHLPHHYTQRLRRILATRRS
jgi:glycosyltransferase involved in cell wall biosynthesis